jgi:hypothetical protein
LYLYFPNILRTYVSKNIAAPIFREKTEAAVSFKTLAPFYQTRRRIVEDSNLHIHHCDNLKSQMEEKS